MRERGIAMLKITAPDNILHWEDRELSPSEIVNFRRIFKLHTLGAKIAEIHFSQLCGETWAVGLHNDRFSLVFVMESGSAFTFLDDGRIFPLKGRPHKYLLRWFSVKKVWEKK